ncbi:MULTISPECIES: prepilin-type N-terminal cleavage/methylation domain-containing protein [Halomonas]|uniref:GspH/FimT family pseudopilin n=1 Tax=Halomonas TaxID=2745 RepID=UPI001C94E071|nr:MULTISPECIES: prepilin-type N-terminal cleavage/methylation domain-containing protein [Halomonas]MBY6206635.1 prepilin-type N-terminal cleavage/methylation domain-containing protein [Halomonas sp. DP3Y7-2]MBY6230166.1 prepilin-type N-terminal cleavage/methylation domain-containing protein [Halomonas sp. DP3Y7-1]MCA0918296.1 prepilin-type N-terminal cleavage/methylation domain-containing protein [Halomonas denitrificans]
MSAGSRRQRGMTLIELVLGLAVVALMATVAVPNLHQWLRHERLVADANQLVGALTLARTTALTRRQNVTVRVQECSGHWRLEVLAGNSAAEGCPVSASHGEPALMIEQSSRTDGTTLTAGDVTFDLMGRLDQCHFEPPCRLWLSSPAGERRWIRVEPSGIVRSGAGEGAV